MAAAKRAMVAMPAGNERMSPKKVTLANPARFPRVQWKPMSATSAMNAKAVVMTANAEEARNMLVCSSSRLNGPEVQVRGRKLESWTQVSNKLRLS